MNREHISLKVFEVYKKCKVKTLPIDCFKLVECHGYKIYTYDELKEVNFELYKLCLSCSDESFIHRDTKIAAYNDRQNLYRIRFSLMHELGHVVLMTDNEDEADYFSSCVLAPRILIHNMHCRTADSIHATFGLSYTASNRALTDYKNWFFRISQQPAPRRPSEPELSLEKLFISKQKKAKQSKPIEAAKAITATTPEDHNDSISDKQLFEHLKNSHTERSKAARLGLSIDDYLKLKYSF